MPVETFSGPALRCRPLLVLTTCTHSSAQLKWGSPVTAIEPRVAGREVRFRPPSGNAGGSIAWRPGGFLPEVR